MASNYLEQVLIEWYEYKGYFVKIISMLVSVLKAGTKLNLILLLSIL